MSAPSTQPPVIQLPPLGTLYNTGFLTDESRKIQGLPLVTDSADFCSASFFCGASPDRVGCNVRPTPVVQVPSYGPPHISKYCACVPQPY